MAGIAPDFDLTMEGADGPARVVGRFNDVTAFERWSKTQPGPPTMRDDPLTFASFVAWRAAARDGVIPAGMDYDTFDRLVVDLTPIVDEVEPGPTR